MTVLAYDPYLTKQQIASRHAEKVELKDLLQRADYVTMHTPRTKETFGMVGYDELSLMKPTAFFINTSRGGTYKEDDLARALRDKKIAGAGIDVFLDEPPPMDHPLMAFENCIVTPHNAGSTHEAHDNVATYASSQWIDIFDGKVPPRLKQTLDLRQSLARLEKQLNEAIGSENFELAAKLRDEIRAAKSAG